jgi:hypothetical protein
LSAGDEEGFFAPPPFVPSQALVQLQRTLRAVKGLGERADRFEWKGQPVITLVVDDAQIVARLAKRPALSPDWELRSLRNGGDVRRFGDDVKRRVERWRDGDD